MQNVFLIAGLGNPGAEYAATRHNVGFMAVEHWAQKRGAVWKGESRFQAKLARVASGAEIVVLCEPQTYMNLSGVSVQAVANFFKIAPERMVVAVDDADLPFSEIRLRSEGSSGGHHGLDSIESHLGTRKFPRLRIGIGRTDRMVREITGHVLGKFAPDERGELDRILDRVALQLDCWLQFGIQKAMSQFNGAVKAPMAKERK